MVCLDHKRVKIDREEEQERRRNKRLGAAEFLQDVSRTLVKEERGWITTKPMNEDNATFTNEAIKALGKQINRILKRIEELEDKQCSCNCCPDVIANPSDSKR